jgi:hypothetical protein
MRKTGTCREAGGCVFSNAVTGRAALFPGIPREIFAGKEFFKRKKKIWIDNPERIRYNLFVSIS